MNGSPLFKELFLVSPLFRRFLIKFENFFMFLNLVPYIICIPLAVVTLIAFYLMLPVEIRDSVVTPITAVAVSAIIAPYFLNYITERKKREVEIFNECKEIYMDLLNNVAPVLLCSDSFEEKVRAFIDFITKYNAKMDLILPVNCNTSLWDIYVVLEQPSVTKNCLKLMIERSVNKFRMLLPKNKIHTIQMNAMEVLYIQKINTMEPEYE